MFSSRGSRRNREIVDYMYLEQEKLANIPNPPSGTCYIFKDESDGKVKRKNPDGSLQSLEESGGGAHTHPQSEVTDLVTDLGTKASASHSHAIADVTDLQTSLDGKSATGHSHAGGVAKESHISLIIGATEITV